MFNYLAGPRCAAEAVISFVCSVGNIPLVAVLWNDRDHLTHAARGLVRLSGFGRPVHHSQHRRRRTKIMEDRFRGAMLGRSADGTWRQVETAAGAPAPFEPKGRPIRIKKMFLELEPFIASQVLSLFRPRSD
jgi:hypothetical protein